jgi:tRNA(Ile2) C34 agmatinyltransferase TiaS
MEHTDSIECFACGGFSVYMASLGDLDWYRCRHCGFEQAQQTTSENENAEEETDK